MTTSQTKCTTLVWPDTLRTPVRTVPQPITWSLDLDLYHLLKVEPGSVVALGNIDPNYCGEYNSFERTLPVIQSEVQRLDRLQYVMHAEGKHSLLIVLQSLDAGGKDGIVRHILNGANPAGCRVAAFKQP